MKNRRAPRGHTARGFTLIEALVALTLFAFVLSGVSSLLVTTIETGAQARRLTAAALLAQAQLEELQLRARADLAGGEDPTPVSGSGAPGGIYLRRWTVDAGEPGAGTSTISVTVAWSDKSGDHSVSLATVAGP